MIRNFLYMMTIGLLLISSSHSKTKFSEIKKALKEDKYGKAVPKSFHQLNAKHAINLISVSDFSKVGEKSIRFELNDGECGYDQHWNDCETGRERTELRYTKYPSKTERWYQFYIYMPEDYNSVAPSKMSLIQWKRYNPSRTLVMFQHTHAGLTFNRNGDSFKDTHIVLKSNKEFIGNWTQIIFSTNWHPDREKGFMKVWIDGNLKVDFKGISQYPNDGKKQSLRYGLYNTKMKDYKKVFNKEKMPQRIAFFDGIKSEKTCKKLINQKTCNNLKSQKVIGKYKKFNISRYDKKINEWNILEISPEAFENAF